MKMREVKDNHIIILAHYYYIFYAIISRNDTEIPKNHFSHFHVEYIVRIARW